MDDDFCTRYILGSSLGGSPSNEGKAVLQRTQAIISPAGRTFRENDQWSLRLCQDLDREIDGRSIDAFPVDTECTHGSEKEALPRILIKVPAGKPENLDLSFFCN